MKKLIVLCALLFVCAGSIMAQTNTATSSPSIAPTQEKEIQILKDKIATKVAELREKNNRAIGGTITALDPSSISVQDFYENNYVIRLDSTLTKYYQVSTPNNKEIKFSDLKKGEYVFASGVIHDKEIDANSVYRDEQFIVLSGKITQVDKTNYALTVLTSDKDTYTLEIETGTKQEMLNIKTLNIESTGFSKIKEGDTIHFVVKRTGSEKDNTYSARKILIIPQEYFMQ